MKDFSIKIKEERKLKKLTQKEVSEQIGVSTTCYAGYEQNYREPDLETLKKICKVLNVSSDYLLGLEDDYGNNIYVDNSFNNNSGNIQIGKNSNKLKERK